MLTTLELLAAAKTAQGIPSNYRLARLMGVPDNTVQRWNTGKGQPDDAMCIRLAELAGLDPGQVVASIRAEREAAGPLHDFWADLAKRLQTAGATAAAAALTLVFTATPDAGATVREGAQSPDHVEAGLNLMSTLRRLAQRLARLFDAPTWANPATCGACR